MMPKGCRLTWGIFLLLFFTASLPAGAEDWYQQGFERLKNRQYQSAVEAFSRAIEDDPDHAGAYNQRGVALANLNRLDQAIVNYTKALDLDPDLYGAMNNRGSAHYRKGNLDRAIADFTRAIDMNPFLEVAYSNRGIVWIKSGDFDRAVKDFTKAIEINPYSYVAHFNRGTAYDGTGSWGAAIEDLSKALDLNPKSYGAYDKLARILASCPDGSYRNGQQAVKYAKKAMELNPETRHLDTLAMALAEVGRFEDAVYVMERVVSTLADQKEGKDRHEYQTRLNTYKAGKPWRLVVVKPKQPPPPRARPEPPKAAVPTPPSPARDEPPKAAVPKARQPKKQEDAPPKMTFTIQAGAFLSRDNAEKRRVALVRKGYDARTVILKDRRRRVWHLVRIGAYESEKAARSAAWKFSKKENMRVSVRPGGAL